jgi:hypothetical protein
MNGMLRDLLGERADAAGGPDLDLVDLIAQGERRVSRRRRAALGGTVAAVALTVGASFALAQIGDDRTSPPAGPPTNSPSTVDVSPDPTTDSRPLTYGLGATIHWGDRVIEAAEDADGLFVLDEGLAILTGDDGNNADNRLYWTDGSEEVEIARRVRQLSVSRSGSLMAWVDGNDVVIYDGDALDVLARLPVDNGWYVTEVTALEGAAYWHERVEETATTQARNELVRYDVETSTRAPASQADYRAEIRAEEPPPVLVIGSAGSADPAEDFTVVDGQLKVGEAPYPPVYVAATGERVRINVPDGDDGLALGIFQWLDDDRFALVAKVAPKNAPIGDLLTCSISAGTCRTLASGEQYWLLPGTAGGVGSED